MPRYFDPVFEFILFILWIALLFIFIKECNKRISAKTHIDKKLKISYKVMALVLPTFIISIALGLLMY